MMQECHDIVIQATMATQKNDKAIADNNKKQDHMGKKPLLTLDHIPNRT